MESGGYAVFRRLWFPGPLGARPLSAARLGPPGPPGPFGGSAGACRFPAEKGSAGGKENWAMALKSPGICDTISLYHVQNW